MLGLKLNGSIFWLILCVLSIKFLYFSNFYAFFPLVPHYVFVLHITLDMCSIWLKHSSRWGTLIEANLCWSIHIDPQVDCWSCMHQTHLELLLLSLLVEGLALGLCSTIPRSITNFKICHLHHDLISFLSWVSYTALPRIRGNSRAGFGKGYEDPGLGYIIRAPYTVALSHLLWACHHKVPSWFSMVKR